MDLLRIEHIGLLRPIGDFYGNNKNIRRVDTEEQLRLHRRQGPDMHIHLALGSVAFDVVGQPVKQGIKRPPEVGGRWRAVLGETRGLSLVIIRHERVRRRGGHVQGAERGGINHHALRLAPNRHLDQRRLTRPCLPRLYCPGFSRRGSGCTRYAIPHPLDCPVGKLLGLFAR